MWKSYREEGGEEGAVTYAGFLPNLSEATEI